MPDSLPGRIWFLIQILLLGVIFYFVRLEIPSWCLAALVFFALWEAWMPRRRRETPTAQRWIGNWGIFLINIAFIQILILPITIKILYSFPLVQYGLFNRVSLSPWLVYPISILLMDFATFAIHRMMHMWPWAWKIHRLHHGDLDMDTSTSQRFHLAEMMIAFFAMQLFIIVIAPPMSAFIFFSALVLTCSIFRHANIEIPEPFNWVLKWVIVTPNMHLIHHSTDFKESNSNFGHTFPFWDHLFGTFTATSKVPLKRMKLGLKEFRKPRYSNLWLMLIFPFLGKPMNERAKE